MDNPWKHISLSDYENHMSLGSVLQLQALNSMMKEQLDSFEADSVMILGAAGGNGLEHVDSKKYHKVYAIDINKEYLDELHHRLGDMDGVLECICVDLTDEALVLPHADAVVADLLIEYIGYECFCKVLKLVHPKYVSCGIQINTDNGFVSESPYLHAFDGLESVHHQMDENVLCMQLSSIGYESIGSFTNSLPNGKRLTRIDFKLAVH